MPSSHSDAPAEKRFRTNATDLFFTNALSASRVGSLISDAELAGARHVHDIARISRRSGRNMHRDLLRQLSRRKMWAELYYVPTRCWDSRRQEEVIMDVAVTLPHELLHALGSTADLQTLASRDRLTASARSHLEQAAANMPAHGPPIVPLAAWLDGTPCNWDRPLAWDDGFSETSFFYTFSLSWGRQVVGEAAAYSLHTGPSQSRLLP